MSDKFVLTPESYVLKFGKYKGYKAVDVAELITVDKNGKDKPTGLIYLEWLCEQEWFKHKDIVLEVVRKAQGKSEADEPKKKKDAKQKKGTVTISTNETLELN